MSLFALSEGDVVSPVQKRYSPRDVLKGLSIEDEAFVKLALAYATQAHEGQFRASGEPFIEHPIAVAAILASVDADATSRVVGLLHDVVEDTDRTLDDLRGEFGDDVARMIDAMTKIASRHLVDFSNAHAYTLRKLFSIATHDPTVLLVKMADRLHNMRTLGALPQDKQRRIAFQTLRYYVPMARRVGMERWFIELSNLALNVRSRRRVSLIQQMRSTLAQSVRTPLDAFRADLQRVVEAAGIHATVSAHEPPPFCLLDGRNTRDERRQRVERLYVKVVISGGSSRCYEVLAAVHRIAVPVQGSLFDQISQPARNGYRALHFKVLTDELEVMVIVQTVAMSQAIDIGFVAFANAAKGSVSADQGTTWVRRSVSIGGDDSAVRSPESFKERLLSELQLKVVTVFGKHGRPVALPKGATCLDYAFAQFSSQALCAVGGIINGTEVPLAHVLKRSDRVDVRLSSVSQFRQVWLDWVVTPEAKDQIRTALSEAEPAGTTQGMERIAKELGIQEHELKHMTQASCCLPLCGDPDLVVVRRAGQVRVHLHDCVVAYRQPRWAMLPPDLLPSKRFEYCAVQVGFRNQRGCVSKLLTALNNKGIDLLDSTAHTESDEEGSIRIIGRFRNRTLLSECIELIRAMPGTLSVARAVGS